MDKSRTDRKMDLLREIEYGNDFQLVSEILLRWKKLKPTETIDKTISAHNRMYFFTFDMQEQVRLMRQMVSEYRLDKNRAIERARKAEKKIETLEKKLKNLKL